MSKAGLLTMAAQIVPRIFHFRRGTWLAMAVGLTGLLVMTVWAAIALFGWLWGQGKLFAEGAPEAARTVVAQVVQVVPGARESLGEWVPALKPEPPQRDVSGTDIGPVTRYPGLARSQWHRDGRQITVRYEGRADYAAVLDHYAKGFAAQGYAQNVISATPGAEAHDYRKNDDQVGFRITQLPQGKVKAAIIAVLP